MDIFSEVLGGIAAEHYGLTLLKNSCEKHDAVDKQNRMVQIKATQINRIAVSSEPDYPHCYSDCSRWKLVGDIQWIGIACLEQRG